MYGAWCLQLMLDPRSPVCALQYDRRNKRVGFGTAPCQALGLGQKPCPNGNSDG